jgi:signal transduction histidine kinase
LNDLRLRSRLILLVLLPLIASLALAAGRVVTEAGAIRAEGALNGQVHVALADSRLVHALQDERDLIAGYLTNGEQPSDLTVLTKAENDTTTQVDTFEAAEHQYAASISSLSSSAQVLALQVQARIGDLPALRASVLRLGDSTPVYQAYTTIISGLLNFSDQLATSTTDHALGSLVSTLALVQQTGEQTAQERGYLVGILGGGSQILEQQEALIQAQAQYNSSYATFAAQAPTEIVNLYQATITGDQTGDADSVVQQTIDAVLEGRPVSSVPVTDSAAYSEISAKIAQIRTVEQTIGQDLLSRTSFLLAAAQTQLYLNGAIIIAILVLAFLGTVIIARSIVEPLRVLRTSALHIASVRLPEVIRQLRDSTQLVEDTAVAPIEVDSADEIGEVARAFDEVHHAAVRLASEQAMLRNNVNSIFKSLSRRSQGLVERQLRLIDALENGERDSDQLSQLFKLDHLATRMRRNNENLLVLAGEETARRWTEAVRLVDVARAASAEVEQYERIMLGEVPRTQVVGKAAPDVAHLVAELLENATVFSAPQTKVWVAAGPADDGGVVLRIEDVGIGMTTAELEEANERIANPPVVDVAVSRRMGLFVVGRLAARYDIRVWLHASQGGGISASIHLPVSLFVSAVEAGGLRDSDGRSGSGVDEEFYALSRQLSYSSRRGVLLDHGGPSDSSGMRLRSAISPPADPFAAHGGGSLGAGGGPGDDMSWFDALPDDTGSLPRHTASGHPSVTVSRELVVAPEIAPEPAQNQRLPIFEAMESDWFRRNDTQTADPDRTSRTALDQSTQNQAAQNRPGQNRDPRYGGTPPTPRDPDSVAPSIPSWTSPGDDGWQAAKSLARPALDGMTATGLPKRIPKANLVPGSAGSTGAAKAQPPVNLPRSAEAGSQSGQGLSAFRRASQEGHDSR